MSEAPAHNGRPLRRVDGKNRCPVCGEPGHGRARHESTAASVQAAELVRSEGLTFREAADRFGVTHQAVQEAFRSRYPEAPTPRKVRHDALLARVADLVRSGSSAAHIAADLGRSRTSVYGLLEELGISARSQWFVDDDRIQRAVDVIRAGGTIGDAAIAAECSVARIAQRLREAGEATAFAAIKRNAVQRKDGRTLRAIARVRAGESVPAACRAERCATVHAYKLLKREREQLGKAAA